MVDIDLGYTCTTFELDGRQVVECLMQALPIVEDFDVFEYGCFGLLSGVEVTEVNQFVLQCAEEALGASVVVTVIRRGVTIWSRRRPKRFAREAMAMCK